MILFFETRIDAGVIETLIDELRTKSALRLSGKGSLAALKRRISLERILKIENIDIRF